MVKYEVKLLPRAFRDLDEIEMYIAQELSEPDIALSLIDELEVAILSLEHMPERGAIRKFGKYAGIGYRQVFVHNYTIVYRINENQKQVIIVTVKYTPRQY